MNPSSARDSALYMPEVRAAAHAEGDAMWTTLTPAPAPASPLTSAGSPRSGNGTSIASKSRGTTVLGNTARASSRISRGK